MIILIPLVALILICLLFGPLVAGAFALLTALAGGVIGAIILLVLGVVGGLYLIGALCWCVWWVFDRKGAMQSLREAQAAREP